MNPRRLQALRIALVAMGSTYLLLGPLMLLWPAGWRWEPHHARYEQMMVGIYFTLGVSLLLAWREPRRHLSLIWFAVWSSIVHAGSWRFTRSRPHRITDIFSPMFPPGSSRARFWPP